MKENSSPREQFLSKYRSTDTEYCYPCLIKEWGNTSLNIQEALESIPKERKVSPQEHERRLSICKQCDRLVNGMCASCGSFVVVRAAKSDQFCAKKERLW